jgi:hypothetical protein
MAVDFIGRAVTYDGNSLGAPAYIDAGSEPLSVSCPSASFCAEVSLNSEIRTFDGSSWSTPAEVGQVGVMSASCPSESFCATVGGDNALLYSLVPSNASPPSISGNTTQGQALSEAHGNWANEPTRFGYQWLRCDTSGGNCTAIAGANGPAYGLVAADIGQVIRVEESATNAAGTARAVSAPSAEVHALLSRAWVGRLKIHGMMVKIPLSCMSPGGASCLVSLAIRANRAQRHEALVALRAAKHESTMIIGRRTVSLGADQHKVVRIKLDKAGRRLLEKRHELRATLHATQATGSGTTVILDQKVTFMVPSTQGG